MVGFTLERLTISLLSVRFLLGKLQGILKHRMRVSLILRILVKHVLGGRLVHSSCPLVTVLVIAESLLHHVVIAVLLRKVASEISICLSSLFLYRYDLLLLCLPLSADNMIRVQTLTFSILHIRIQS